MRTKRLEGDAHQVSKDNAIEYVDKCYDGGIWYKNENGVISFVEISPKALDLLGYSSLKEMEQLGIMPSDVFSLISYDESESEDISSFLANEQDYFVTELVMKRKDGSHVFVGVHASTSYLYQDECEGPVTKIWLSKLSFKEMVFRRSERMLDCINDGIILFSCDENDSYHVIYCNHVFVKFINDHIGARRPDGSPYEAEDFYNINLEDLIQASRTEDEALVRQLMVDTKLIGRASCAVCFQANGQKFWVNLKAMCKHITGSVDLVSLACTDLTRLIEQERQLKAQHDRLKNLYYHDPLTGVLNRKSFNEYMAANYGKTIEKVGVAFVDCNGLKLINENLGHGEGDKTIVNLTKYLRRFFEEEQIFRLAGDEFVIIDAHCKREHYDAKVKDLSKILALNGIASIGSTWSEHVADLEKQVDTAEELMRIAKKSFYATHEEDILLHRPQILDKLISDIDSGRFQLYLQPKAAIDGTYVTGAEALVRKISEDGTVIPPVNFVPMLEKEHLVSRIDFFMVEEVCKTLDRWKKEFYRPIKVSVNMSRVTLAEPEYINKLMAIVKKYDVDPSQIEIEITESSDTIGREEFRSVIAQIKQLGFGMALDDMGSDYSTVRMLEIGEIDTVKLDRSMVLRLDTAEGEIMIRHLIDMCHALGKICLAEGVEDNRMRQKLMEMACDMYQGYLLAKPIPVMEFEKLM